MLLQLFLQGWETLRARLLELPDSSYPHDLNTLASRIDLYMVEALSEYPEIEKLHQVAYNLGWGRVQAENRLRLEEQPEEPLRGEPGLAIARTHSEQRGDPVGSPEDFLQGRTLRARTLFVGF